MSGRVVAEEDDEIGREGVRRFDDLLDPRKGHVGLADMEIREGGDPQGQVLGPARQGGRIGLDAKPVGGLDSDPVDAGGGNEARRTREPSDDGAAGRPAPHGLS